MEKLPNCGFGGHARHNLESVPLQLYSGVLQNVCIVQVDSDALLQLLLAHVRDS